MACFHDDYVDFPYGGPSTLNKADYRKNLLQAWANYDAIELFTNKPLAIRIVGDVAVIH